MKLTITQFLNGLLFSDIGPGEKSQVRIKCTFPISLDDHSDHFMGESKIDAKGSSVPARSPSTAKLNGQARSY